MPLMDAKFKDITSNSAIVEQRFLPGNIKVKCSSLRREYKSVLS